MTRGHVIRPHLRGITPSTLLESARRGPLRGSALLDGIAVTDLAVLMDGARWVRFTRGDNLTLRGSRPGQCWLLLTGYVKEHRPLDDGSEALCGFRGPGDLVAEIATLMLAPCEHDVTALGHGEALAFPADHLQAVTRDVPQLRAALLRAVAARATTAETSLARNNVCDTSERVVLAILELAERWGVTTSEGVHIGIPITQTELAEWVGASRETAAKALQRLRRDGLVETSRRRLVIQDLEGLHRAGGLGDSRAMALPA